MVSEAQLAQTQARKRMAVRLAPAQNFPLSSNLMPFSYHDGSSMMKTRFTRADLSKFLQCFGQTIAQANFKGTETFEEKDNLRWISHYCKKTSIIPCPFREWKRCGLGSDNRWGRIKRKQAVLSSWIICEDPRPEALEPPIPRFATHRTPRCNFVPWACVTLREHRAIDEGSPRKPLSCGRPWS